ncbi:glycoside hydrolase family 18 protein [Photorhabdus stackebrandtii]|uniref:chitinase n=1 Tax=Photorhabdus stackebrandtii TaxID=1123042 RepID=A0A7X5TKG0_9GAMM|nr:glycoside hydrolase family 18 protein [Photorhabdus stackebrandtii]NHB95613.1 chitinase [Photorhabdus stackebrandtii]
MVNKYTYTSSRSMSDVSDIISEPLTAWKNQAGGQVYNVIFNGGVYTNTYWVERWHVPDPDSTDGTPHNAWKYIRPATEEEIKQHGNPTDGSINPTEEIPSPVLQPDAITVETYQRPDVNFKPDGSGNNLSYTAARVCRPMYNEYESDKSRPKLSAYITDWCQYDARLDGKNEEAGDRGRGFDLSTINVTAYDKLIFSFLGIYGDTGVKGKKIKEVAEGWNSQSDIKITEGHIVPLDPYGDLGTARNVGLPKESANTDINSGTFLPFYQQKKASGLLGGLRELQKTARLAGHKLELAFSIGGWSMSGYFSVMAADVAQRRVFVDSIVDFFARFPMFSCVDIDWEYPGSAGEVGNVISEKDGEHYALLIKELRESLDSRFGREARKEISIACSGVKAKLKTSNIAELVKNGLDNIFLMSYDYFGTGWAPYIGHHTNLYSPTDPDPSSESDLSAEVAINYLHQELGIPLEKIHLGYANYGRAGKGANLETREYNKDGDALGTMEKGSPEFFDIVNNYLDTEHTLATGKNSFELMTDTNADADFLYSEKEGHFISLDTPRTVKQKAEYVARNKLGGIFSWSGDQDCGLLANAAREGMGYVAKSNDETIDMGPLYNPGKPYYLKSVGEMKKNSD